MNGWTALSTASISDALSNASGAGNLPRARRGGVGSIDAPSQADEGTRTLDLLHGKQTL